MSQTSIHIPELQAGKPEISMAPLIDVIFLLLIFFMVTTVFPENRGMEIDQPTAKTQQQLPMKKMTFMIGKDNAVYYQNKAITETDVARIVRQQLSVDSETAILLQIDKSAFAQTIIGVMDACKDAGAQRIGIATKQRNDETARTL